ncbi:MAG: transcriptional regulator, TetR family [Hydrocarboniphaga sp.]|uniref:TetR/AcrR family transcriptional regulator n=1 Tax=Hydrocarboniphaga sp. TaxID=2033016 RepID=UPI002626DC61|nr:TetR/AcrR family transcriptional regulator [Hydrocarboniphaga sp.]MDB5969374.1 transcriptional regulator, TetR family [Hydrocarboniphaga sp.]
MAKLPALSFNRDMRVEDKIVDATVKCFQRFGINKTSMDDIAKVAKVSRPTIYRYFPSRHHLAVEVLVREIRDHTRLVTPVLRETRYPPKAMLEGIVLAVSTAREHPYTQIVLSDAGAELLARVPGTEQSLLDAMGEQWLPSLTRWREAGYIKPSVRLDDLLLWITFYMHASIGKGRFMAITEDRMRRMLEAMLIPSVFDFDKLKVDFPDQK